MNLIYIAAIMILTIVAGCQAQGDSKATPVNAPCRSGLASGASISGPVDTELYKGWKKIEEATFSFYAPIDVIGGKRKGIDSSIYRYDGTNLNISFDIGDMANPEPKAIPTVVILIDGQTACTWERDYRAQLYIALGEHPTSNFNMYVDYQDLELKNKVEKIFRSLRLKKPQTH